MFRDVSLITCIGVGLALAAGCGDYEKQPGVDAGGGNLDATQVDPHAQKQAALQAALDQAVGGTGFAAGAEIFVEARGETWNPAGGLGNMAPATPMRSQDKFRGGSMMKTLIGAVVLQMVEEGSLSLEDTLSSLLPAATIANFTHRDKITVAMLLNNTSGVPEFLDEALHAEIGADPSRIWTEREWLEHAAAKPQAQPGTLPALYSNTNFVLLGLIIDQVSGRSWREEVRKRVIQPLQLTNTFLPEPGDTSMPGDHAHGYVNGIDVTAFDPSMAGAAGGSALVTNTADLHRFLRALLAGKLFRSPSTVELMLTWVEGDTDAPGFASRYYGLGLEKYVALASGLEFYGHGGGTAGYSGSMMYFPAADVLIAADANTEDLANVYLRLVLPAYEIVK